MYGIISYGRVDCNNNKPAYICNAILQLINKQLRCDYNNFTVQTINEFHFTSAFVYPLFHYLFDDISRSIIYQKWGETKLMCAKTNEHRALSDGDRRTPGPNIDAVFTIPAFNNTEFFLLELSGSPVCDDYEHYLGDRNKLGKNMKLMMKQIISLRANNPFTNASSLKIYGIQVYKNEMYVYSLTSPVVNRYMFDLEIKFGLLVMQNTLNQSFPNFMQNMWKLKQMIVSSYKSVELFLLEEESSEEEITSNLSSPYVSPTKRK